jgi:hypothetical protein
MNLVVHTINKTDLLAVERLPNAFSGNQTHYHPIESPCRFFVVPVTRSNRDP